MQTVSNACIHLDVGQRKDSVISSALSDIPIVVDLLAQDYNVALLEAQIPSNNKNSIETKKQT